MTAPPAERIDLALGVWRAAALAAASMPLDPAACVWLSAASRTDAMRSMWLDTSQASWGPWFEPGGGVTHAAQGLMTVGDMVGARDPYWSDAARLLLAPCGLASPAGAVAAWWLFAHTLARLIDRAVLPRPLALDLAAADLDELVARALAAEGPPASVRAALVDDDDECAALLLRAAAALDPGAVRPGFDPATLAWTAPIPGDGDGLIALYRDLAARADKVTMASLSSLPGAAAEDLRALARGRPGRVPLPDLDRMVLGRTLDLEWDVRPVARRLGEIATAETALL